MSFSPIDGVRVTAGSGCGDRVLCSVSGFGCFVGLRYANPTYLD